MSTATITSSPPPPKRTLLVFGLIPSSAPSSPWPPSRLNAALSDQQSLATERNWDLTVHTVDPSVPVAEAMAAATKALGARDHWDVVSVGFGLRGNLGLTAWFERLVNLVVRETALNHHQQGKNNNEVTRLGFATSPDRLVQDSEALVEREVGEGRS